jgi:basic membrane protein A
MKKSFLYVLSLLVVASMVLTACGGAAPATQAQATEAAQFTCALITPNPLGDRSFIDASARGIERANSELPVKCDIIETNGVSEHETALRGAISQDYDLILGLAMDTEMFVTLAE